MKKCAVVGFSLLFMCFGQNALSDNLYRDANKKHPVDIFNKRGISMSNIPSCQKNQCLAQKAIKEFQANTPKLLTDKFGSNPTSQACLELAGLPETYFYENGNEVAVCSFKDKSFFLSWDLFSSSPARK